MAEQKDKKGIFEDPERIDGNPRDCIPFNGKCERVGW